MLSRALASRPRVHFSPRGEIAPRDLSLSISEHRRVANQAQEELGRFIRGYQRVYEVTAASLRPGNREQDHETVTLLRSYLLLRLPARTLTRSNPLTDSRDFP